MSRYNSSILIVVLLLYLTTSIGLVIAAEQTETTEETKNEVTQADTGKAQTTKSSPNITFTPTEEISEDLPVSFPADI